MRDRERSPESSSFDHPHSPLLVESGLSTITLRIYHWWDRLERDWQAVICAIILLILVLVRVPIPW